MKPLLSNVTDDSMTFPASFQKRTRNSLFNLLLLSLLCLDAIFIGLHVARGFLLYAGYDIGLLTSDLWLLERDRGLPETFQYLKALSAAVLLWRLFRQHRNFAYSGWALAFLFVFLDDVAQLHEVLGDYLEAQLELPTVLGVDDFLYAESLLWVIIAALLTAFIGYAYVREPATRNLSRRLFYLFGFFFLFAGLADAVHASVDASGSGMRHVGVATIVEEGGEMLALSLLVACAIRHCAWARAGRRRAVRSSLP